MDSDGGINTQAKSASQSVSQSVRTCQEDAHSVAASPHRVHCLACVVTNVAFLNTDHPQRGNHRGNGFVFNCLLQVDRAVGIPMLEGATVVVPRDIGQREACGRALFGERVISGPPEYVKTLPKSYGGIGCGKKEDKVWATDAFLVLPTHSHLYVPMILNCVNPYISYDFHRDS